MHSKYLVSYLAPPASETRRLFAGSQTVKLSLSCETVCQPIQLAINVIAGDPCPGKQSVTLLFPYFPLFPLLTKSEKEVSKASFDYSGGKTLLDAYPRAIPFFLIPQVGGIRGQIEFLFPILHSL